MTALQVIYISTPPPPVPLPMYEFSYLYIIVTFEMYTVIAIPCPSALISDSSRHFFSKQSNMYVYHPVVTWLVALVAGWVDWYH